MFRYLLTYLVLFGMTPAHARQWVGAETQAYRPGVSPQLFPILQYQFESLDQTKDIGLRFSALNPKAFIIFSENFYQEEQVADSSNGIHFTWGRKKMNWSGLDEYWKLGLIEPLNAWDRLRPQTQGLTGLFGVTQSENFIFRVFVSGITFPEFNPNISLSNGRFESIHPQSMTSVPQTFTLLQQDTPITYSVTTPNLTKILFRPSIMVSQETKDNPYVYGKITYGYLPLNSFPLQFRARLNLNTNAEVDLEPRLLHHHIYGLELQTKEILKPLTLGFSGLVDQPSPEDRDPKYTLRLLSTQTLLSPWVKWDWGSHQFFLGQMISSGGLGEEVGPEIGKGALSSNLFFRNATQVKWINQTTLWNRKSESQLKALYEWQVNGVWIAWDQSIQITHRLSAYVGIDVIYAEKPRSTHRGAEFLYDLRSLDRFFGGFRYEI